MERRVWGRVLGYGNQTVLYGAGFCEHNCDFDISVVCCVLLWLCYGVSVNFFELTVMRPCKWRSTGS